LAETINVEGRWVDLWLHPLPDGGVAGAAAEATGRVRVEERLARQANFDVLTSLPSRHLLSDRLVVAMARTRRGEPGPAVLLLDVDRLGRINESLGSDAGDELLIELGQRLVGHLRPADSVGRFVADKFVLLCETVDDAEHALAIADRLRAAVSEPFVIKGREVFVTASIGVVLPAAERDADAIFGDAEAAMYRAKAGGGGRIVLFDHSMRARALVQLETEQLLYRALERNEFRLHYQPVIDLREGTVAGLEALLRWDQPERGLIPPGQFIPLAEETRLILPIGYWVLEEVCRQIDEWQGRGLFAGTMTMAVNLSAVQLGERELADVVETILNARGLAPGRLCFEITESWVMEDVAAAIAILHRFREMGISLAVDDFGTGFSSLGYLNRLPIDALKVDRVFVQGLDDPQSDSAIAEAIVGLAQAMRLSSVGEGVETADQLAALRRLGCDQAQGYLFARPLPAEEVAALLEGQPRW
jgi:diguanylate cyclase (GGDEF)-like protein